MMNGEPQPEMSKGDRALLERAINTCAKYSIFWNIDHADMGAAKYARDAKALIELSRTKQPVEVSLRGARENLALAERLLAKARRYISKNDHSELHAMAAKAAPTMEDELRGFCIPALRAVYRGDFQRAHAEVRHAKECVALYEGNPVACCGSTPVPRNVDAAPDRRLPREPGEDDELPF